MRDLVSDRAENLVRAIGHDEFAHAADGRISDIVEHDDAADVEQLIDVEEIDERMVERVPSIDEPDTDALASRDERRQHLLRGVLVEFVEVAIARALDIVQAAAAPLVV